MRKPLSERRDKRRLAAILSADVVGYSRLMGANESGTLAALKAHEREVVEPNIAEHQGRIVKLMGDGVLAEFASAVDAVQCAAATQDAMAARQEKMPEDQRIVFRIGINVGDVIVENDDIYGDAVNIAARIQERAEPGGIVISGTAQDQVRGKLDLSVEDLGEWQLKNIERPVRVFRVRTDSRRDADTTTPSVLSDRPSIAVLPFDNLSGDAEQDYFSDGITEDIITALARVRWFFVIARNSTFAYKGQSADVRKVARDLAVNYVLEGSVRKAGSRVRITAQLVDGTSGAHLWAKRYDRELEDIFAVQDEITETIVGEIEPELSKAERQRARSKKPGNLDAWDIYQRGLSHLYRYTSEDVTQSQKLFRQAISLDPDLGPAHSGLAEAYYYQRVYGLTDRPSDAAQLAFAPAQRAVELDAEDAAAHCTLGRVHYMRRESDAAIQELETAIELNPSLALAHYGLGAALVFSGRAPDSVAPLNMAIRLSPRDPNMGSFLVRLADAHLLVQKYEDAVEFAKRAIGQPGIQWSRYAVLLSALGHLGRREGANAPLEEMIEKRPDFCRSFVRQNHLFADPDDFAHYLDGMEKAGVPE